MTSFHGRPRPLATNGIVASTYVAGQGPTVVLAHGFPDLAYTWRHQVPDLVASGYQVVVPDMRGYGATTAPSDVAAYQIDELAADLVGLLDALDEEHAVFVGHDWGANVVWHVAATHEHRVRGVVGLSVPYAPPAPAPPTEILRRRLGEDFYMIWFQEIGAPDDALSVDVRRTLVSAFGDGGDGLTWRPRDGQPPSWLDVAELEVYVEAFARTGFTGGLNYYRNIDRNWQSAREHLAGHVIRPPAMFVTGSADPVARFMPADGLAAHFADLRQHVVLEGAGHWLQQERPVEVNALLKDFLASLPSPSLATPSIGG